MSDILNLNCFIGTFEGPFRRQLQKLFNKFIRPEANFIYIFPLCKENIVCYIYYRRIVMVYHNRSTPSKLLLVVYNELSMRSETNGSILGWLVIKYNSGFRDSALASPTRFLSPLIILVKFFFNTW